MAESNLRSMYPGPSVSPKSSPQAGGDALASKPTYAFTRFGLWEAANAGPTPLVQQGPQDTPLITPAERSASVTPSPPSDVTPGQRDGLTSALESHGRPLPPPGMHQAPHYHHQPYQRSKAHEAQKNADLATSQRNALQSQLKDTEANLQTTQKNADLVASERDALRDQLKETENRALTAQKNEELATSQRGALQKQLEEIEAKAQAAQNDGDRARSQRDALQTQLKDTEAEAQMAQKNADLATRERDALETQLGQVKERAQLAEMHAALAASKRDAMEADLKKAEEEAQLAHQNADLAVSQHTRSQEEREDAQPAHEDAVLATNQPESGQMQPPNPGQNAKPAPLTQALDSSVQAARP
jgi:hypothetical protein